jgi:hypothetical protein
VLAAHSLKIIYGHYLDERIKTAPNLQLFMRMLCFLEGAPGGLLVGADRLTILLLFFFINLSTYNQSPAHPGPILFQREICRDFGNI